MNGNDILNSFFKIFINSSSNCDRLDHMGEIIVDQD